MQADHLLSNFLTLIHFRPCRALSNSDILVRSCLLVNLVGKPCFGSGHHDVEGTFVSSQVITRASRSDIDLSGNIRFAVNEADVPTT